MSKSIFNPLLVSSIVAGFLLVGCNESTTESLPDESTATELITGQLVDSYVKNADYLCEDGSTGITDVNGTFNCATLPVRFRLGGLELGEITVMPSDKQIFPQDLLNKERTDLNNSEVVAMARFLQSCDSDNDPSNGIDINESIKIDLADVNESFQETNMYTYINRIGVTLVDENRSNAHLKDSTDFTEAATKMTAIPASVMSAILTPDSELDQNLTNTLSFMGNEERVAYDLYNKLYETFPTLNQFTNIATKSEIVHIQTVQLLVQKYVDSYEDFTNVDMTELGYKDTNVSDMAAGTYDIQELQDLYDALIVKGQTSEQDALEVGCMVEVTDIYDLDRDIKLAEDANATDIVTAFNFLRTASYSHYWAFDKGLKNKGIVDGCCSLGVIDGVDYCHPEYPVNENGGDMGSGGGHAKH